MMMAGRGHPRQSYIAVRLGPRRSRARCHPSNHPIYRAIVTSGGKPRHHDGTIKPRDGRYFAGKPSDGVMVYRLTGPRGRRSPARSTTGGSWSMSACERITDSSRTSRHVRNVPKPEVEVVCPTYTAAP